MLKTFVRLENKMLINNQNLSENLLPQDGHAQLLDLFLTPVESDRYFQNLQTEIMWKQEPIKIFGKPVMQPRLTALYGDLEKPYKYSGTTMTPKLWTNTLLEIKWRVEAVTNLKFTTALLNQYRNGQDSMGWHRDNEKELGPNPTIASVSFGATRRFLFRHYNEKDLKAAVDLTHGSLLIMSGSCQHFWQHSIPKTKLETGPRINLTFRTL